VTVIKIDGRPHVFKFTSMAHDRSLRRGPNLRASLFSEITDTDAETQ